MRMNNMAQKEKETGTLPFLFDCALSACMAFALAMDMNVRSGNNYHNWGASMPDSMLVSVLFALALFALRSCRGRLPRLGKGSAVVSLALGLWWVLAQSIHVTLNIRQPFLSSSQLLKTIAVTIGTAVIYHTLYRLLACALGGWDWSAPRVRKLRITQIYRKHTTLFCMTAVLLMWLWHFAAAYPASANSDTQGQMSQILGIGQWNENHPLLNTALIHIFLWIGKLLGSANAALFAFVLTQGVFAAAVIGYSQSVMRRLDAPRWLRVLALIVCGIIPVYTDNITVILKDVPYTYAIVLLLCECVRSDYLEENGYWAKGSSMLRFFMASLILLSMRNNGMGILAPMCAVMIWRALRAKDWKRALRHAVLVALAVVLISGAKGLYRQGKTLRPVGVEGGLSIPLQQTARFVCEHGDEIPEEERAIIDEVIEYESIVWNYDPIISDPIKAHFRQDATRQELMRYFGVWAKQFVRDPMCYLEAVLIQNALLFDPQTDNLAYFMGLGPNEAVIERLGLSKPALSQRMEAIEINLRPMLLSIPMAAQLCSMGFHCILLMGVLVIARRFRVKGIGMMAIPQLMTMLMVVLSATITMQDRYGFPIIYCMPLLLACLSHGLTGAKNRE